MDVQVAQYSHTLQISLAVLIIFERSRESSLVDGIGGCSKQPRFYTFHSCSDINGKTKNIITITLFNLVAK